MKWVGGVMAGWILIAGMCVSACRGDGDAIDTVATPLGPVIQDIRIAQPYYNKKVQLKTRVFYRANGHKTRWLRKKKPDAIFRALLDVIRDSQSEGFVPTDYDVDQLEKDVKALYANPKRTAVDVSTLDIRITASFFLFTTHLLEGRIRYPGAAEFFWTKGMPLENDIALLLKIESADALRKTLGELRPDDPQYERLQEALDRYRVMERGDTLSPVSVDAALNPGDTHHAVEAARERLRLRGDLKGRSSSPVYDEELVDAVRWFQTRYGLEPDGVLGPETVALLNEPVRDRSAIIALNLERLRWHPHVSLDADAIVVNIPEYMLRVYRNKREKMKMRVVLGAEYTPTPVFYDTLKYIVFSPTWIVPRSIFEREFLPRLREDSFHYDTERFRFYKDRQEIDPAGEDWSAKDLDVRRYLVIENPGDANSLGKVKFIMPNDFSVYLHDTPASRLFQREERALSHGCIRLEKPADLATYLLRQQRDWDESRIRQAMQGSKPVRVDLEKDYPVYLVYRTAWVDDGGNVNFRRDIYGHDQRQLARLAAGSTHVYAPALTPSTVAASKRLSTLRYVDALR